MNRMVCFILAACALLASAPVRSDAAPAPKRIRFDRGAISARVRGQLARGQDETFFVLEARQGQHMVVNLSPGGGTAEAANAGEVIAPSGAQEGGKGGVIYDATLGETGEYRIRVARNLMATHGGVAGFTLEVVIY